MCKGLSVTHSLSCLAGTDSSFQAFHGILCFGGKGVLSFELMFFESGARSIFHDSYVWTVSDLCKGFGLANPCVSQIIHMLKIAVSIIFIELYNFMVLYRQ